MEEGSVLRHRWQRFRSELRSLCHQVKVNTNGKINSIEPSQLSKRVKQSNY